MEHNETGCQAPPEAPILCINNCGFFGSATTLNLCSKCYKDSMLKQDQAKLAASSIGSIVNGSSSTPVKESDAAIAVREQASSSESVVVPLQTPPSILNGNSERVREGPNKCTTCQKRVGLTGFNCRCGNLFCAVHRYSDKHDCPFDYRAAARNAIARANPVIKAEKVDKI